MQDQSLDASSDTRAAGLPSPNVVRINNRESERWYDYDEEGSPLKARDDGRARSNDEPTGGQDTPTKSASGRRPGRNDEAKRLALAAGGDPNDWYRHDHGSNGTDEATRTGKRLSTGKDGGGSESDGTPLWFASDGVWHDKQKDGDMIGKSTALSPKNRHADPTASAYYRRDKTGSSAEWYPHVSQPTSGSGDPQRAVSARRSGSSEADDIARRLKNESEDWYVYDGPGEGRRSPRCQTARAVSPEVRRMQALNTGDQMKQTLRMDDNIQPPASVTSKST